MPTLILTPRYSDDTQALWKAAAGRGWSVERLGRWQVPDHLRQAHEPVLYAEALFGPSLAEQLGITLASPPEDWLVRLPEPYRKREIQLMTLAQARGLPAPAFIKPPNDKTFPAQVYAPDALPDGYDEAMPVLVSDIVRWACEFRCFIRDRRLVASSIYSRDGELQKDNGFASTAGELSEVHAFLATLLDDARVDLPVATVVDVGLIEGSGWAAVEQNAAWGAGIYGCDPDAVLDVLHAASGHRR
jgi:hypothetical protein